MGHWISKGRAEFETTDLGLAAFEGNREAVRDAIRAGVRWSEEGQQPLIAALYGEHFDLAVELLRAGAPVEELTYRLLFQHARELLSELPPNPELISRLERDERWAEFTFAVFQGDADTATRLLDDDIRRRIDEQRLYATGIGEMAPLHYAARRADVRLLKLVLSAGADVRALAGNGKSALRLVAETPSVEDSVRREAFELLERAGAELVPPVSGFWKRWLTRRGAWLQPG